MPVQSFLFAAAGLAGIFAMLCAPVRLEACAAADLAGGSAELRFRYLIFRIRLRFRLFLLAPPEFTAVLERRCGALTVLRRKRRRKPETGREKRFRNAVLSAAVPETLLLRIRVGCGDAAWSVLACGALRIVLLAAQQTLLPPRFRDAAHLFAVPSFDGAELALRLDGIISVSPAQIILAYLRYKER